MQSKAQAWRAKPLRMRKVSLGLPRDLRSTTQLAQEMNDGHVGSTDAPSSGPTDFLVNKTVKDLTEGISVDSARSRKASKPKPRPANVVVA